MIYWIALGAISVIHHLLPAVCFVLDQFIGALWAILPRYRKLARENLSASFREEMTPSEFTALAANGMCG